MRNTLTVASDQDAIVLFHESKVNEVGGQAVLLLGATRICREECGACKA
jgi:hypothetical protein